jgi:cbb3-type cytochrome oxidase subunit 3
MDNREILLLICLLVVVELFWVFWRIAKRILKRARRKKHHPLKDDAARYS